MSNEQVEALDAIYLRFTPSRLTDRYAWLFSHNPELPDGKGRNWDVLDQDAEKGREHALRVILETSGVGGIKELIPKVSEPQMVGWTLGRTKLLGDYEEAFLLENLANDDPLHARMARGLAAGAATTRGRDWLEGIVKGRGMELGPHQIAELLLCVSGDSRTWALVEEQGDAVEKAYWAGVGPFQLSIGPESPRAIQQLLGMNRAAIAVTVAYRAIHNGTFIAPDVIAGILEALVRTPNMDELDAHMVGDLLAALEPSETVPVDRIAGIEWTLLPTLKHGRHCPRFLLEKLASDPAFYIDVLSLVYRADGDERKTLNKQDQRRAQLGHQLLNAWRSLPGNVGGALDAAALSKWVLKARQLAKERKRTAIGDQMIGQMLSGSPSGNDGIWPHEAVRDLFEKVRSIELERGFQIGHYNSRGVVSKGLFEGGGKERELAENYRAAATKLARRWPRTAAVLRRIADSYKRDASRQDAEADLREDGLE
jgi:hypothetical protein